MEERELALLLFAMMRGDNGLRKLGPDKKTDFVAGRRRYSISVCLDRGLGQCPSLEQKAVTPHGHVRKVQQMICSV